jgi:hypothetical protein
LKLKVDAQAALAAFKLNLFRKRNKSTNAKLKTFFKVAVGFSSTAYLLLFPVFQQHQSYETGIAQTKIPITR